MNSDQVQTNGAILTGHMKEKWGALTDDDLAGIAGKKDRLAGKLRERYGYAEERAQQEAEEFLRVHPGADGAIDPRTTESDCLPAHLSEPSPGPVVPSLARDDHHLTERPEAVAPSAAAYAHTATVWISPRVLRWVAPISAVALFVFLFLPWTGAYPGGYRVYTQNAFQTIWGGVSVDPVGMEAMGSVKPYGDVGANRWMLLYTLLVLLALVLTVAPLVLSPARVQVLPPIVQALWRRRLELLAAVAVVACFLLMAQLWMGFGLEKAAVAKVDNDMAAELAAAKTPEEREKAAIHRGLELAPFAFGRTLWLHLAVFSQVLLVAGPGLELWIRRRGSRPLPRIELQA